MLLLEGPRMAYVIDRFVYVYIYMHIVLIWTSSLFSEDLCPYSSPGIPETDLPTEIPFLESLPRTWKRI